MTNWECAEWRVGIGHDGEFEKGRRRRISLPRDDRFFPVFSLHYNVNDNPTWRTLSPSPKPSAQSKHTNCHGRGWLYFPEVRFWVWGVDFFPLRQP